MVFSSERDNGMPSIRCMAKLVTRQPAQVQIVRGRRGDGRAHRQHGRQHFGSPENGLLVERLLRISCEKTVPTAVGNDPAARRISHS